MQRSFILLRQDRQVSRFFPFPLLIGNAESVTLAKIALRHLPRSQDCRARVHTAHATARHTNVILVLLGPLFAVPLHRAAIARLPRLVGEADVPLRVPLRDGTRPFEWRSE